MFTEIQQPGYLHVIFNHIPIIGTAMGAFALVIAMCFRHRSALITALAVILVSGIAAYPVYKTGEAAYKPIRKIADDSGVDWLDEHMDRADRWTWVYYVMAVIAIAAIIVPVKWPGASLPLAATTLIVAISTLAAGAYIAQAGGRVRHSEFRPLDNMINAPPTPDHQH
ncbi:MAG: hypothetical protein ACAI35_24145 [Candidatus Methylacidiphilales bacterium]|nr:hypothetical protein [Candidatus Methylacidiphilales bacterium]